MAASETRVLRGTFTDIKLDGGTVSLEPTEDGFVLRAHERVKVEVEDGSCLKVSTEGQINIRGSFGSSSYTCISGGISICNGRISLPRSAASTPIYVDGRRMQLVPYVEPAVPDPNFSRTWKIVGPKLVSDVTIGCGSLECGYVLDSARVCVGVSGSGDVKLPKGHFVNVDARVSGQGIVDLGGSTVEFLTASVSGQGTIKEFRAMRNAHLSVSGMGAITGTADPGCSVHKSVSGMGNISVPKRAAEPEAPAESRKRRRGEETVVKNESGPPVHR